MKKIIYLVSILSVLCSVGFEVRSAESESTGNSTSSWYWPSNMIGGAVGPAGRDLIDCAYRKADLLLSQANNEGRDLIHFAGQEGVEMGKGLRPVVKEMVADFGSELEKTGHKLLIDELQPVGHMFIVDLSQNVGKMALSTILGCFGAALFYNSLIDYVAMERDLKPIHVRWHERQLAKYKNSHSALAAQYLLNQLTKLELVDTDSKQQEKLIAASSLTFVAACISCCYWIR